MKESDASNPFRPDPRQPSGSFLGLTWQELGCAGSRPQAAATLPDRVDTEPQAARPTQFKAYDSDDHNARPSWMHPA